VIFSSNTAYPIYILSKRTSLYNKRRFFKQLSTAERHTSAPLFVNAKDVEKPMSYFVPVGIGTVPPVRARRPIGGWTIALILSYRYITS
jgi:hypothetical protein